MLGCFFAFSHPAWIRLAGLGCADWGKKCPSNKWFRLLGLSCNVVQNKPSFLVSFSLLFDLIKNSCYCSIDVASLRHLYIYILTNSLFILSDCLPSPSLQADSISLLPAREINERKQTIIRELQLLVTVISVLKTFLFCFLDSSQTGTKKRTKETP